MAMRLLRRVHIPRPAPARHVCAPPLHAGAARRPRPQRHPWALAARLSSSGSGAASGAEPAAAVEGEQEAPPHPSSFLEELEEEEPQAEAAAEAGGTAPSGEAVSGPEAGTAEEPQPGAGAENGADADADPVASCRAWVRTMRMHDPGDYEGEAPGQEKVGLTIDLSPLQLSPLEQAVARGVAGRRFNPARQFLALNTDSYTTPEENLEAAYTQARELVQEVRRLAAEISLDDELPQELVIAQLGGDAWSAKSGRWVGQPASAPPSAPVPGVLNLHMGNLPRGFKASELHAALAAEVPGPVAVDKKRRGVFARVTGRDDGAGEAQKAVEAVAESLSASLSTKHPVKVAAWSQ